MAPFLTFGAKWLERQLDSLLELAEEGWQIVCFSVKEEVREYLAEYPSDDSLIRMSRLLPVEGESQEAA